MAASIPDSTGSTPPPMTRRAALELLGTLGAALGLGCAAAKGDNGGSTTTPNACAEIPDETAGPYPDQTGMLGNSAFYRRDITEGKAGLPLSVVLTVVDVNAGCTPVADAVVEVWHCDADGHYSEYSQPGYDGTGTTFLRGLQTTDQAGQVTFTTVYPGWYSGRATHIHLEVFVNGASVKTTQLAFPESVTAQVYATGVYASRGNNPTTNAVDNIFEDGEEYELATLSGDTGSGYTASLTLGVGL